MTMPAGVRQVCDYWKANLQPGGFKFTVQVIDDPGGKLGNVGLFFSWPCSWRRVSTAILTSAHRLRGIVSPITGIENIDIAAATELGIASWSTDKRASYIQRVLSLESRVSFCRASAP